MFIGYMGLHDQQQESLERLLRTVDMIQKEGTALLGKGLGNYARQLLPAAEKGTHQSLL